MNWLYKISGNIPVEKINDAVLETIKLMVNGKIEYYNKQNKNTSMIARLQRYEVTSVKITDVKFPGDEFLIKVFCYIYTSRNTEPTNNIYTSKDWAIWAARNPLHPVTSIDSINGHHQVRFACSIKGKKPEYLRLPFKSKQQKDDWDSLADIHMPVGYEEVGSIDYLDTPYEVGEYINSAIDKFYRGGDGNDEIEDSNPDPSPQIMSPSPALVGV